MDDVPSIVNFDKVIEPFLDGAKFGNFKARYLTKPGDNYGSVLLAIDAAIENTIGDKKNLQLVAKLPPINELLWQMFNPERTCRTEIAIYKELVPSFHKLQRERGVSEEKLFNGFPKYYGSRLSLDSNSNTVDNDALLVLENLQYLGFCAGDRHKMFDLTHAQLILQRLAEFHALSIALRYLDPKQFEEKIFPHFKKFNGNECLSEEARIKFEEVLFEDVSTATNRDKKILNQIRKLIECLNESMTQQEQLNDEYCTIAHCDLWVNNILIKYDNCCQPVEAKFIDFQMSQLESCAIDLIFFLFSSVDTEVLEFNLDELLQLYYDSFILCLQSVGVRIENYSYVGFMKEIHTYAPIGIISALSMLRVILADESTIPKNFKDLNLDVLSNNDDNQKVIQRTAEVIRLAIKYRMFFDK